MTIAIMMGVSSYIRGAPLPPGNLPHTPSLKLHLSAHLQEPITRQPAREPSSGEYVVAREKDKRGDLEETVWRYFCQFESGLNSSRTGEVKCKMRFSNHMLL